MDNRIGDSEYYMVWYADDEGILNSSSGGTFTAIAEVILKKEGEIVNKIGQLSKFLGGHNQKVNIDLGNIGIHFKLSSWSMEVA